LPKKVPLSCILDVTNIFSPRNPASSTGECHSEVWWPSSFEEEEDKEVEMEEGVRGELERNGATEGDEEESPVAALVTRGDTCW